MIADWAGLKASTIGVLPGFSISLLVLATVLFIQPQPNILVTGLCVGSLIYEGVVQYRKRSLPTIKSILWRQASLIGYVLFIIYLTAIFGLWGLLGFIMTALVIAGIILYRQREQYMRAVRHIETIIWGQPLDKKKEERK